MTDEAKLRDAIESAVKLLAVIDGKLKAALGELPGATIHQLQTMDEDAGKCCRRGLGEIFRHSIIADKFICPACGLEYRPESVGDVRHWRIVPATVVMQLRG